MLALGDAEGMIIKTQFINTDKKVELLWAFGGASGKRFSRNGDIGADPESSFYLQPVYCKNNDYTIHKNKFQLKYSGPKDALNHLSGIFPVNSIIHIAEANEQTNPSQLFQSDSSSLPVVTGKINASTTANYFLIQNIESLKINYSELENVFNNAEKARGKIANRIQLVTPDAYINTLGGALCIAADAIWEAPSYLRGAVAWRIRLPGWRGPYVADPLGWHERAKRTFH